MTLAQRICGLRGHDAVLHFESATETTRARVLLRCTSCQFDSPGLDAHPVSPRRRFDGDPRRHVLSPLRLVFRRSA